MAGTDKTLFQGFQLQDLYKQIVENSRQTRKELKITIQQLSQRIQSITDVQILSPEIKDYMNILVKNDQILVKLAGFLTKTVVKNINVQQQEQMEQLTQEQKDKLLRQVQQEFKHLSTSALRKQNVS